MPKKFKKTYWKYRPLLTETLPYEVPIIFSNDILYFRKCNEPNSEAQKNLFQNIFGPIPKGHTIPYNYKIKKDTTKRTQLSLVHPLLQFEVCEFYERYEAALLNACARSNFSLRYPSAVAAVYASEIDSTEISILKEGITDLDEIEAAPQLSRISSYFSYRKINLLSKFFDSREFINLEKTYPLLRKLDVSKCFYSIYTHSIGWAVKSKDFIKQNLGIHSFDAHFDQLMQRCNFNETNGIVVGPEFSRIFAEIILQSIDLKIENKLKDEKQWEHNENYAIRRYVDDYFVFAHDSLKLDAIEAAIRDLLEEFKLYLNESKVGDHHRPFISDLASARSDLKSRFDQMREAIEGSSFRSHLPLTSVDRRKISSTIFDVRATVHKNSAPISALSSQIFGFIKSTLGYLNEGIGHFGPSKIEKISYALRHLVEIAFYVSSIDLRVRTSYALCQFLIRALKTSEHLEEDAQDILKWHVSSELGNAIISYSKNRTSTSEDTVEIYNLLICGAHLFKSAFVESSKIREALKIIQDDNLTYFKYITLKYCFLKSKTTYSVELEKLNTATRSRFTDKERLQKDSELFHMLIDYWSAPDVDVSDKLSVYKKLYGGTPSKADFKDFSMSVGFCDWNGVAIENSLKRRQLRPVYAVA